MEKFYLAGNLFREKARGKPIRKIWVKTGGVAVLSAALFSCAPLDVSTPDQAAHRDRSEFVSSPYAPPVRAVTEREIGEAARIAAALSSKPLEARGGQRSLEISALPWLRSSPEGALFLSRSAPRAIARGEPSAACPAAGVSPAGTEGLDAAARGALGQCARQLDARDALDGCTCRLLLINDVLLAPHDEFSYAPVVSTFLIGLEGGARRAVAESLSPVRSEERALIRDLDGPVGFLRLLGEEAWLALAENGMIYTGQRQVFGYRRGRLAERLVLKNTKGDPLTVLIGVERRDALPAAAR